MASCGSSTDSSGTSTWVGGSSSAAGCCWTAGCSSDGIPAVRRIVWISSASVRSLATATCTMPTEACLLVSERAALDEDGRAPLRERDVDDIEVPGHDRLRKDGSRLAGDLGSEVPVGEVREG